MDREGKATRTGNEAESREGGLNATLGAEPQLAEVGEQAPRTPSVPFSPLAPALHSNHALEKDQVCRKQKSHPFPPSFLVAPGNPQGFPNAPEALFPGNFQGPSESEGSQISGPCLALAARLPHRSTAGLLSSSQIFAVLLYTPGLAAKVECGGARPQDTHSPGPTGHRFFYAQHKV